MAVKKFGFFTIILIMLAALFTGCSGNNNGGGASSSPADKGSSSPTQVKASEPAKQDLKPVNLKMVLLGDAPADMKIVLDELNKKIKADLNVTLSIEYMPWSDWEQKYSLVLSSGEPIDLIYTSDWAHYVQEATKGAFVEVTDDILTKYMPLTKKSQDPISYEQAKIKGKMYFVPKNSAAFNGEQAVLIRGDLREKYGLAPLKSVDELRKYLDAVVKNEKGIFPYAASQGNESFRILMQEEANNIINVGFTDFQYNWKDDSSLTADKIEYKYDSPTFVTFAKEMKKWANLGYWPKNAISNKTQPRDAFENGTSASLIWNSGTVSNSAAKVLKDHPTWKPEVYDVLPDNIKRLGLYTADGMAVPASSKNSDRAFMLLDKLKNDRDYYELFQNGIKDKNWIPLGNDGFKEGPDFGKFGNNANGQWGVNNSAFKRTKEGAFPAEALLDTAWRKKMVHPVSEIFVFDESNVKNELAALTTLRTKYREMIDLGMAEDADKAIKEWRDQADKAGLKKVEAEVRKQLQAFLDSKKK